MHIESDLSAWSMYCVTAGKKCSPTSGCTLASDTGGCCGWRGMGNLKISPDRPKARARMAANARAIKKTMKPAAALRAGWESPDRQRPGKCTRVHRG